MVYYIVMKEIIDIVSAYESAVKAHKKIALATVGLVEGSAIAGQVRVCSSIKTDN